jgi:hypothetical protein
VGWFRAPPGRQVLVDNHVVFGPIQILEKVTGWTKNPAKEQANKKQTYEASGQDKTNISERQGRR